MLSAALGTTAMYHRQRVAVKYQDEDDDVESPVEKEQQLEGPQSCLQHILLFDVLLKHVFPKVIDYDSIEFFSIFFSIFSLFQL